MAENHELRLKINAAAAQQGSRDFVAAVKAVKDAVKALDRDGSGAFTRLKKALKDIKDTGKATNVSPVDRKTITTVESYAAALVKATRQLKETRTTAHTTRAAIERLNTAFGAGKTATQNYAIELSKTNTILKRTIELARQARGAMMAVPSGMSGPVTGSGAKKPGGNTKAENDALNQQEAMRNRITRAIDNQRAATVSLQAQLARIGATGEVDRLEKAFLKFQGTLTGARVSAKAFDDAQTQLNTAQKTSKVALSRMNAQIQEQKSMLHAAASAAREQATAFREMAKAAGAAAVATSATAREAQRLEGVELAASKALRSAGLSAAYLKERLQTVGNTSGITQVEAAAKRLESALKNGVSTTGAVRRAVHDYEEALKGVTTALVKEEAEQRRAARADIERAAAQRQLISNARQIEREMRSQAGAANAASQAWGKATGNMRGLENAMNLTYQAGSLLRNMLGGLTLGSFVGSVYKAGAALEQFVVTMQVATGSMKGAYEQVDFVNRLAGKFGTDLRTAREDYAKFAVAAELAGASTSQSQEIFESVSMALSVMGRGSEDQRLAFLALEQMMSKGCHAPGSLIRMADGSDKKVEDIRVGEKLMGPDGQPRVVLALAHGSEEMFRVTPEKGSPFEVNLHHKLRVFRGGVAETLVLADMLAEGAFDDLELIHSVWGGVRFTVESVGEGEFHGFLISGDHLYLDSEGYEHHNTVSSEELRRQLGERLPGAVNLMARAVGVTTGELQDMLKAGELASAEVLPKFAKEVEKAFGPGLEASTGRASRNIGTFRNEVEKFLSSVADSGFMDVLAAEFSKLTKAMKTAQVADFARDLGHQLASAAQAAGTALRFLIDNAQAAREAFTVIGIALLVSKLAAVGAATMATGQQMLALAGGAKMMRDATAITATSTDLYTASLTRNTAAATINANAQRGLALATATVSGAQGLTGKAGGDIAKKATDAATKTTKMAGAMSGASTVATRLGMVMGGVGRLFALANPWIMAAGVAYGAYTLYASRSGDATEEMADDITGALRRSGAMFKDYGDVVEETALRVQRAQNTMDMVSLQGADDKFIKDQAKKLRAFQSFASEVGKAEKPDRDWNDFANHKAPLGIDEDFVKDASGATKKLVGDLWALKDDVLDGTKTWADWNKALDEAFSTNIEARPLIEALREMTTEVANGERGMRNLIGSNIELGKSDVSKLAHQYAQFAGQVVAGGRALTELNAERKRISGEPGAGGEGGDVLDKIMVMAKSYREQGKSQEQFLQDALKLYARDEDAYVKAVEAKIDADQKRRSAQQALTDELAAQLDDIRMRTSGLGAESKAAVEQYAAALTEIVEDVTSFNNTPIEPTGIKDFLAALPANAADAGASLEAMWKSVPEADRNARTLIATIDRLQSTADSPRARAQAERLEDEAEKFFELGTSADEANRRLQALKTPPGLEDTTQTVGELVTELGNASVAAEGAASAADSMGASMEGSASSIDAATEALRALLGVASTVQGVIANFGETMQADLKQMALEVENAALDGVKQKIHSAVEMGEGRYGKNLAALRADIAAAETALRDISQATPNGSTVNRAELQMARDEAQAHLNSLRTMETEYVEFIEDNLTKIDKLEQAKKDAKKKAPKEKESDEAKARRAATEAIYESRDSLKDEAKALQMVIDKKYKHVEVAQLQAVWERVHGKVMDENLLKTLALIDAETTRVELLREQAERGNPFVAFLEGTREAIFDSITAPLTDAFMTGKWEADKFGDALKQSIASFLADSVVDQFKQLFSNERAPVIGQAVMGGIATATGKAGLGDGPSEAQAAALDQTASAAKSFGKTIWDALMTGGTAVANLFGFSLGTASTTAAAQINAGVQTGGAQAAAAIGTSITASGTQVAGQIATANAVSGAVPTGGAMPMGGGGTAWGGMALAAGVGYLATKYFSEGGYASGPAPMGAVSAASFANAPHYKEGTPNTSGGGIPAVLHPNEAVIPLSKGRKIPVDLSGTGGGGGGSITMGDINVSVESRGDGEADNAMAMRIGKTIRENVAAMIDMKMAEQMQYGGMMNPRGGK